MSELTDARRERDRLERVIDNLRRRHETYAREQRRCVNQATEAEGDLARVNEHIAKLRR